MFILFNFSLKIQRSSVRLGAYNITSTNDEAVQDVNVIRTLRHPDYDERYGINDIAILYLERDVDATRKSSIKLHFCLIIVGRELKIFLLNGF